MTERPFVVPTPAVMARVIKPRPPEPEPETLQPSECSRHYIYRCLNCRYQTRGHKTEAHDFAKGHEVAGWIYVGPYLTGDEQAAIERGHLPPTYIPGRALRSEGK